LSNRARLLIARRASRVVATPKSVDAPVAVSFKNHKQKYEAIQNRKFSPVLDGPETPRGMRFEIGNRHFATGNERGTRCEYSEGNESAAKEFDNAGDQSLGIPQLYLAAEHTEQFLSSVTRK
jgi:hypothetical protein